MIDVRAREREREFLASGASCGRRGSSEEPMTTSKCTALVDALERLIDAKARPRSMSSSDDAAFNHSVLLRDAEMVAAARRFVVSALEKMTTVTVRGRCGRCGADGQVAIPMTPGDHSHIVVSGERALRNVTVTKYVCTACGYVEEWVEDAADLPRLGADWRAAENV
jgi:hypothetical protein